MSLYVDIKYANLVGGHLKNFKRKNQNLFNFSCPLCGDSKKNAYKARGYFYIYKNKLQMKCHNCSAGLQFGNFLKQVDPALHRKYVLDTFYKKVEKDEITYEQRPTYQIKDWQAGIIPAAESKVAMDYLRKRGIPEDKLDLFYFTEDLNLVKDTFQEYKDITLVEEPRMVLPVFSEHNTFLGFITRAVFKSKLRYVNLKKSSEEPFIFGLNRIDRSKQIFVFEGAFDSLFIPNSIAVDGADFSKAQQYIQKDRDVLVYDNQPRNVELLKIIQRTIDDGWRVCIWPEGIKEKDINEMIQSGRTPEEIQSIISSRAYSGLKAKLEFGTWRKRV